MFQVLTVNVTSIIFEILNFLFKIVIVFETLQKNSHFQNCFCECSLATGITVCSTFSLYDCNVPFIERYKIYWAGLS